MQWPELFCLGPENVAPLGDWILEKSYLALVVLEVLRTAHGVAAVHAQAETPTQCDCVLW